MTHQEKNKQHCAHHFEYSHQEIQSITGGTAETAIDVVICIKCGLIKRQ